jgi:hypothetical protein
MIAVGVPTSLVLGSDIVRRHPSPHDLLKPVVATMRKPLIGRPHRPSRVIVAEPELVEALAPGLLAFGIACVSGEVPELRSAVADVERNLSMGEVLPALVHIPGVTPEHVGRIYAAAAHFYRAAPWRLLPDEYPISIHLPRVGDRPRYAVAIGGEGQDTGLVVFRSLDALEATLSGTSPEELIKRFDHEALSFGTMQEVAFADLDAKEALNWEVAGPNAYPLPILVTRKGEAKPPSVADLLWYEAALLTVPAFVQGYLIPAFRQGKVAVLSRMVRLGGEDLQVTLRCPPEADKRTLSRRRPARR